MAFCTKCGNDMGTSEFCPSCGQKANDNQAQWANQNSNQGYGYEVPEDKPSGGLKVLSFFMPLVGLIMFAVMMNKTPVSAKAYGKAALIGFIIGIVLEGVFYAIYYNMIMTAYLGM